MLLWYCQRPLIHTQNNYEKLGFDDEVDDFVILFFPTLLIVDNAVAYICYVIRLWYDSILDYYGLSVCLETHTRNKHVRILVEEICTHTHTRIEIIPIIIVIRQQSDTISIERRVKVHNIPFVNKRLLY